MDGNNCRNALRQRLKAQHKERQQEWWQAQHQLQWERSVEEVDFINATEKKIIFLMTWSLTKLRREERESVRCGNFPYFLQNEMLIFSLAHCFQLISITLFSLSSRKRFWCYSPWCTYSHTTQSFFNEERKIGRLQKWGDFLPNISAVVLCQLFS